MGWRRSLRECPCAIERRKNLIGGSLSFRNSRIKIYACATECNIFCLPWLVELSKSEAYNEVGRCEKYENAKK